jgi:hypothetical protein
MLPTTLIFQCPLDESDSQSAAFWQVLNHLSSSAPVRQRSSILRVHWGQYDEEFDWLVSDHSTDSVAHAAFVRRLMKVAVLLHGRGIIVVDRHARGVGDLWEK